MHALLKEADREITDGCRSETSVAIDRAMHPGKVFTEDHGLVVVGLIRTFDPFFFFFLLFTSRNHPNINTMFVKISFMESDEFTIIPQINL